MWKPIDLRLDLNMMKGGSFDNVPIEEISHIIESHKTEFEKVKGVMPGLLVSECIESLDALERYYKSRLSKSSRATRGRGKKPAPEKPAKQSPTEKFKARYGAPPTTVYREQFGVFDKNAYARWLTEQVREDKAK